MNHRTRSRAFTILELIVVIVVAALIVGILLPATVGGRRHHHGSRQIKDSTHIRAINQGMVLWAQAYQDQYPLPSLADANGATISGPAEEKDTTANILSIMIYAGFFSPELAVSPSESNRNISGFGNYQYSEPKSAVDPKKALWDPSFSADFTVGTSHTSYAHLLPTGERRAKWSNTFRANEAVVGNRGPEISDVTYAADGAPTAHRAKPASNTDLIHGPKSSWEGNICYNDNHVSFELNVAPPGVVWMDESKKSFGDVLFHAEAKDPQKSDAFLGVFVKAGKTPADFKAIWD
jgi:type II secretory pathway pseudopilin PulG